MLSAVFRGSLGALALTVENSLECCGITPPIGVRSQDVPSRSGIVRGAAIKASEGRSNPQGTKILASYDWIDVGDPQGYNRLVELVDREFDPEGIAHRLESEVTDAVKGVLVEHGYVDKDYRSTFYNFYAKKGRQYRPDCVRLHFFDGSVRYDESRTDIMCGDLRPQDHYFGYIVLRPTIVGDMPRSCVCPEFRQRV